MQKAFEKIIEKVKEEYYQAGKNMRLSDTYREACIYGGMMDAYEKAQTIVKQVVEEYKSDNGWIPCNEKTPSGEFYHLVSTAKGGRTIARYKGLGKWWDLHSCEVEDEVIAWQPLPQPYVKKE